MVPAARLERVRSCLQGILSFEIHSEVTGINRKIRDSKRLDFPWFSRHIFTKISIKQGIHGILIFPVLMRSRRAIGGQNMKNGDWSRVPLVRARWSYPSEGVALTH